MRREAIIERLLADPDAHARPPGVRTGCAMWRAPAPFPTRLCVRERLPWHNAPHARAQPGDKTSEKVDASMAGAQAVLTRKDGTRGWLAFAVSALRAYVPGLPGGAPQRVLIGESCDGRDACLVDC